MSALPATHMHSPAVPTMTSAASIATSIVPDRKTPVVPTPLAASAVSFCKCVHLSLSEHAFQTKKRAVAPVMAKYNRVIILPFGTDSIPRSEYGCDHFLSFFCSGAALANRTFAHIFTDAHAGMEYRQLVSQTEELTGFKALELVQVRLGHSLSLFNIWDVADLRQGCHRGPSQTRLLDDDTNSQFLCM